VGEATVTVKAVDAYGNRLSTGTNIYTGTIKFTDWTYDNGDAISKTRFGNSILPTYYTFTTGSGKDNGYHVFNATASFRRATTNGWIKARDETAAKEGTKSGIVVNPNTVDHLRVEMPGTLTAGVAASYLTVVAEDAYNNCVGSNYEDIVTFESNIGTQPDDYEAVDFAVTGGSVTKTSWVTMKKTGTWWFKVKDADDNPAISGTKSNITVNPNNAVKLYMSVIGNVKAGEGVSVQVQALDNWDNVDTSFTDYITFDGTDKDPYTCTVGGVEIPTTTLLSNGSQSYVVKFFTVGDQDLYANYTGLTGATRTATVSARDPSDYRLSFSGLSADDAVTSGRPFTITVKAVDDYENTAKTYHSTATFSSDAPAGYKTLPDNYIFVSDTDQGIHTWTDGITLSSANTSPGWSITVEDANDPGITETKTGIKVLDKPQSAVTMPWNNMYSNALTISSGTMSVYDSNYAIISKMQIRIYCEAGPQAGKDWNEGGTWVAGPVWKDASFSNSAGTWTYTNLPTWASFVDANGRATYRFYSKAYDTLYGTETVTNYKTFVFDNKAPDSSIDLPDDSVESSINIIQGTSWDPGEASPGDDVIKTEIAIKVVEAGTTYYWDFEASPATWTATTSAIWKELAAGKNWSWDSSGVTWKDQLTHTIYSRATDRAGNTQTPTSKDVVYDVLPPQSGVSVPSNGDVKNALSTISGTSSDPNGIQFVTVKIQKDPSSGVPEQGYYWDGTDWVSGENWVSATNESGDGYWGGASEPWSLSGVNWDDEIKYYITSRASDTAGNFETSLESIYFTYDVTSPTGVVLDPQTNDYKNWNPANWSTDEKGILGTAYDKNGLSKVELVIKRDPGFYWDGSSWQNSIVWLQPGTTNQFQNWLSTGIDWQNGKNHRFWVRVIDNAGNKTAYNSDDDTPVTGDIEQDIGYAVQFNYDESTPTAGVTDPLPGNYYNVKKGTITGTCDDPTGGSGAWYVKIEIKRNNGDYWQGDSWAGEVWLSETVTGGSWEYNISPSYINTFYENNEDFYEIYLAGVDYATNEEQLLLKSTYYYDVNPPESGITVPVGSYIAQDADLGGTCSDPTLGRVDEVEVRLKRKDTNEYWNAAVSSWSATVVWSTATLSADATYWWLSDPGWEEISEGYEANVRAKDVAGNYQTVYATKTFQADFSDPNTVITEPKDGWDYDTLDAITGTSSDNFVLNKIKIDIKRVSDNYRWDNTNSTWTNTGGSAYWNEISGAGSWQFDINYPTRCWSGGESYVVTVHAVDGAGNEEATDTDNQNTFNFKNPPVTFKLGGFPTEPVAGQSYDITGTAWDGSGVASAYRQWVEFETSDSYAVVPSSYLYTTADAGVHTWTGGLIFKQAGSQSVTLKDEDDNPAISTTTNVTVQPGALDHFKVEFYPTDKTEVTAGELLGLKVTAYDGLWGADGNQKTDFTGEVNFSCTDTQALYPVVWTFESSNNGQKVWPSTVSLRTANLGEGNASGTWSLTASGGGKTGSKTGIKVYPGVLDGFVVEVATGPWTAGVGEATVTVKAVDAYGNRLSTGTNI